MDHSDKDCWFINSKCQFCQKTGKESVGYGMGEEPILKGKESVGYIVLEELIQIVNSIPSHDPGTQQLQLNGKSFNFEVDSVTRGNFCLHRSG